MTPINSITRIIARALWPRDVMDDWERQLRELRRVRA